MPTEGGAGGLQLFSERLPVVSYFYSVFSLERGDTLHRRDKGVNSIVRVPNIYKLPIDAISGTTPVHQ